MDKWRVATVYPERAAGGDYRTLDLRLPVLCIDFGGLYLLAGGLARFGFDAILRRAACQTLRM